MRFVLFLTILCMLSCNAYAESIEIAIPSECSALNGTWSIEGGDIYDIDICDTNKIIEVNKEKQKFVIYGANDDAIFGDLNIDFIETSLPFIFDVDITYASTDAQELTAPDYHIEKVLQ